MTGAGMWTTFKLIAATSVLIAMVAGIVLKFYRSSLLVDPRKIGVLQKVVKEALSQVTRSDRRWISLNTTMQRFIRYDYVSPTFIILPREEIAALAPFVDKLIYHSATDANCTALKVFKERMLKRGMWPV